LLTVSLSLGVSRPLSLAQEKGGCKFPFWKILLGELPPLKVKERLIAGYFE
jgi:hypothetical protein